MSTVRNPSVIASLRNDIGVNVNVGDQWQLKVQKNIGTNASPQYLDSFKAAGAVVSDVDSVAYPLEVRTQAYGSGSFLKIGDDF